MPHPGGPTVHASGSSEFGMRPPRGFEAEKYPLRHRVQYSAALTMEETRNSSIFTLVKNYKTVVVPNTIIVNPHNTNYVSDAGAVCAPMSIIDKLTLNITFSLTEQILVTDKNYPLTLSWFPIFFSFPEKLDAADDDTTTTVAAILGLTKDATEEDIIPTWSNLDLTTTGLSEKDHPLSTVNLAEVGTTHLGLTTDAKMEAVAFNKTTFIEAITRYTNKGALKACIGRQRNITLTENRPFHKVFIKKFVPRAIRRIVPYSYMAILVHLPVPNDYEQHFYSGAPTTDKPHVGVKITANYHEWNIEHDQDRKATA